MQLDVFLICQIIICSATNFQHTQFLLKADNSYLSFYKVL